ncbi:MAG: succinate dehydrogenase, hydrophobic membrane anchor protein [Maricaulaceae bacterium]|nr:succinate dehydrogenase, hydrophobic membrane anchor protein [Maricaulaceae bacterium]
MTGLRTPMSRVRGLGAAKSGTGHFIAQRVSALALLVLLPLFAICLARSGAPDADAARAFFGSPGGAVLTLLTLTAVLYHMRLGAQVVIEDYLSGGLKTALLVVNTLLAAGLWLAAAWSLLILSL